MEDGILLQSVEGLDRSPFLGAGDETWERLQSVKEEVSRKLSAARPLCHSVGDGLQETEASEDYAREIEWRHRGQLEARLREINNALDRLRSGAYGKCADCGRQIARRRLAADPAAPLCLECQNIADSEQWFRTL